MKSNFLYLAFLILISHAIFSQDNRPLAPASANTLAPKEFDNFTDRLYFGGNVGAWFGSTTYINASPLVGCKINKEFSIGAGIVYNYFSQTNSYGKKFTSTVYGGNIFARYLIFENAFAQVGWDRLSVPDFFSSVKNNRVWVDNILMGGGYRQAFSERGSFVAAIFYNINQSPLSPYPNPIIQVGFNVGL